MSRLIIFLWLLTVAHAAPRSVVVYDLAAEDAHAAQARQITDALLLQLSARSDLTVIGQAELKVMVGHAKDRQAVDQRCATEDCLGRLLDATQAETVISGRLGRIGDAWTVTLKLIDSRRVATARGEVATADSLEALTAALEPATRRLLGEGEARTFSPHAGGIKVAVLELSNHDVTAGLGRNLTQLLSLELKRLEGVGVITRDEVQTMLRFETEKQALKCESDLSCLMEIGGALGVDYLVAGSIGRLDDTFVLSLKLLDIAEAKAAHRVAESFRGPERDLPQVVRHAARALLGRAMTGEGSLVLRANVDDARVVLDGADPRPLSKLGVLRLGVGKHGVTAIADDHLPLFQEVFVEPDRQTTMRLDLPSEPTPWYAKWWTWAIAGAVVAGAITTTVIIVNQQAPETGTVRVQLR